MGVIRQLHLWKITAINSVIYLFVKSCGKGMVVIFASRIPCLQDTRLQGISFSYSVNKLLKAEPCRTNPSSENLVTRYIIKQIESFDLYNSKPVIYAYRTTDTVAVVSDLLGDRLDEQIKTERAAPDAANVDMSI